MSDRDITLPPFSEHEIKQVEVLHLEPGDACVLRYEGKLTAEAAARIKQAWERAFTGRAARERFVLDSGMSLDVLRTDAQGPEESTKVMPPGSTSPEPGRLSPIPAVGASDEGAGESCLGPLTQRKGVGPEQAGPAPTSEAVE